MERCRKIFFAFVEKLKNISLEALIVRLASAWAIMGIFQNIRIRDGIYFTHDYFFSRFTFFGSFLIFLAFFLVLNLPLFVKFEKGILWASWFLLFARTLWQRSDFGYYMGAVLIMTVITAYSFKNVRFKKDLKTKAMWGMMLPFTALVASLILTVTILLYKACWTPTYDFGLFSQMFYYMKETFLPLTTCERDTLLSHFSVHFSPIFYLLLPVYFVIPSPVTLLVAQVAVSVSGIIPLVLLCRKYNHSNLTTLFLAICYMGVPGLSGGNLYYLHENVFLSPLLLWLFYFCEKKSVPLTMIFSLLVMLVKEDAPVYIVIFGIYLMASKKNVKLGAFLSVFAVVYFVGVLGLLESFGEGAMVSRFENFNKSGEPITLVGVIITAFRNPAYLISECFQNDRMLFLLQLFIPMMFLPFFTRKYSRFILLLPVVIVNLLSDYGYQHDMDYQYVFGPLAFLIYMCVMNSADMGKLKRSRHLLMSATASVLVFMSMYYARFEVVESYKNNMKEHIAIEQALEKIPDDASVVASTFFVANLSQREEIYEMESTKQTAEYYVLDLRYENTKFSLEDFQNENYETIHLDKYIGIFRAIDN